MSGDDGIRRRFEKEAELPARLEHPNIVTVFTRGTENGRLWLSMQYVEGVDLSDELRAGPIAPERAVRIITETAAALDCAHQAGVLHRDVKPANIMLTRPGDEVRLVDFGIAKSRHARSPLTETSEILASFHYVAPERFAAPKTVDHRADIYSLGCTLYQMLTGALPYRGDDLRELLYGHLEVTVPRPSEITPNVPEGFDAVIARALAKDPADRYDTCAELASAAHNALSSRPVSTHQISDYAQDPDAASGAADTARVADESEADDHSTALAFGMIGAVLLAGGIAALFIENVNPLGPFAFLFIGVAAIGHAWDLWDK